MTARRTTILPRHRVGGFAVTALTVAGLVACSSSGSSSPASDPGGSAALGAGIPPVTGSTTHVTSARKTVTVTVPEGMRNSPFDKTRRVQLPSGWHMAVWARVPGARTEVWAPDGRLVVSRPGNGDVVALTPHGSKAPTRSTLASNLREPFGLAFHGSTLYVGESHQIDSYTYRKGKLSSRRVIVSGLPDSKSAQLHGTYAHALKALAIGRDGSVYISVGSSANISTEDRTASPPRAVILKWSPTTKRTTVFARGVRNGSALGLDPAGALWTGMNNRDNMPYPFHRAFDGSGSSDYGKVIQSYVNDHPLEPVAKVTAGRDLGWPYCDPDPSVRPGAKGSALAYAKRPFVNDPDTNPTGSHLDCAKLPRLEQGLPAHSAPLGLSFTTLPKPYGVGALVTSHGSWNRTPPRPPSVTFFPWRNGTLGNAVPLVTGFQDSDGSRWGRTVDTVAGPDRALYLSDDDAGAIYRITTR
ncbi:PQQ-dependent sugar dehydrogenase [uncultured Jatrophihabitans sp.]|uniref:PQQ-dependent sugar dehydrogenase n=1 Tax=uncultured Jatrophihabitans sp. TaxID=1610747 RepID=UPI0035C98FB1